MTEFSSGEITTGVTGEPEPGTPEFGMRAKLRKRKIAEPAPEDQPTAEELATAEPVEDDVLGTEGFTAPDPTSGTASVGAQPPDVTAATLSQFDVPVPTLTAILDDPNPPDESDPEGDIFARLSASLFADSGPIPQPRPFTQGEHIALGIIGALDPEAFQSVVLPMLQAERNAPRAAALDLEKQKERRIAALQALSVLMESRRLHQATIAGARESRQQTALTHRDTILAGNANRRAQIAIAQMKAAQKAAAKVKIGDRALGTYTLAVIAHQDAVEMKKLLDNNVGLFGDEVGGPIAGRLPTGLLGKGGDMMARVAALGGTVNESIMMITQRRGLNKETQRKIGGSLPDIRQSGPSLRRAIETAIRTTGQFITGTEAQFPTISGMKAQMLHLIDTSKGDPDAITAIVQDPESWLHTNGLTAAIAPGEENGDTDMNLWIDDDEVAQ